MLAMSTSPASASASSYASVATASSATVAAGAVPSSATGGWHANCAKSSSMVGAGLRLPPAGCPTVSQSPLSPCSTGSEGGISRKQENFVVNIQHRDISTRLPYSIRLTSCDVVSVTFNFLVTRLRATLRGLLGGAGRLASRLVGGSWTRGMCGNPGRPNLDRSWKRSCSVSSSSSSSDVSSTTTVSSPSPTSRHSLALAFHSSGTIVWTSLGLPRWVPGPTTRWAPGTTWLALHDT
jgi:hypothetical protein